MAAFIYFDIQKQITYKISLNYQKVYILKCQLYCTF